MSIIGKIFRKIHGGLLGRPTNFSWFIEGKVAASGRPMSKRSLEWVKNQNVQAICSLTEDRLPEEWVLGLTYLHIPTADHKPPYVEDISKAVDFITEQVSKNVAVLVHCNAGLGRTGTILAAYLVRSKALKPKEAVATVRKRRSRSIEKSQEEAVKKYFEWLYRYNHFHN